MSKNIGTMHLGSSQEVFIGRDFQTQVNYSDAVAAKIDAEIKAILDEAHERAINILKENRDILDKMVKILFEKETFAPTPVKLPDRKRGVPFYRIIFPASVSNLPFSSHHL